MPERGKPWAPIVPRARGPYVKALVAVAVLFGLAFTLLGGL